MMPQFFTASKGFVLEGFQTQCTFDYFNRDLYTRTFMILMFLGGFVLPFFLIIFFYVCIWRMLTADKMFMETSTTTNTNVRKSVSSMSKRNTRPSLGIEMKEMNAVLNHNPSCPVNRLSVVASMLRKQLNMKKAIRKEIKILKTILTIVCMFCVAWLPYAVVTLTAQFANNIEFYITPYSTSLPAFFAKLSSIYNPIVFILTSKNFKEFYKKSHHPTQQDSQSSKSNE